MTHYLWVALWPFVVFVAHYLIVTYYGENYSVHKDAFKNSFLLVTAHPDDECMFFTPVIEAIKEAGGEVHLLCLSTGNSAGLGQVRRAELHNAASRLRLNSVEIVDDPSLKDGMNEVWAGDVIAAHVELARKASNAKMMITFDGQGVSGHPNHVAIHSALKGRYPIYFLKSQPLYVKYLSFLGWPLISIAADAEDIVVIREKAGGLAQSAMYEHRSQLVWFRRLFIYFSVYVNINVLQENKVVEA